MKSWLVEISTEDYVEKHNLSYKLSAIQNQIGMSSIEIKPEGRKTEEEIRTKIEAYGGVAKGTYDHEYSEAMASIHMLRWVLGESADATGED